MTARALPDVALLTEALEATWPPAGLHGLGPVTLRDGAGGGQRVSAATVEGRATAAELDAAIAAMGTAPLFRIGPWTTPDDADDALPDDPRLADLDRALTDRGFRRHDVSLIYAAPVAALAGAQDRAELSEHWPPTPDQRALWVDDGIGPERIAVMGRAAAPKAVLQLSLADEAAAVAFVAQAEDVVMLHALMVAPHLRRRGLARRLMAGAALWAETAGASCLALAVTAANRPARALYEDLGMVQQARYHYLRLPSQPATDG